MDKEVFAKDLKGGDKFSIKADGREVEYVAVSITVRFDGLILVSLDEMNNCMLRLSPQRKVFLK